MRISILLVWGLLLCLPATAQQRGEWFWDADPGYGNGQAFTLPHTGSMDSAGFSAPTSGLVPGLHRLYLRTRESSGLWGHTVSRLVEVVRQGSGLLRNAEYFWDLDPGYGRGQGLALAALGDTTRLLTELRRGTALTTGIHRVYMRFQDDSGRWSHTVSHVVQRLSDTSSRLVTLRYRLLPQPGTWTSVGLTPPAIDLSYLITDTTLAPGLYTVEVQVLDSRGGVSCTQSMPLTVVTAARGRLLQGLRIAPVPTQTFLMVHPPGPGMSYTVLDARGRACSQGMLVYPSGNLDVRQLPVGVYLLRVEASAGPVITRFVKE